MRLAAAAALLLPLPALAQRVDTRLDDVRWTDAGFNCRSHAHPNLLLTHGPKGELPAATLALRPGGESFEDLRLILEFTPGARRNTMSIATRFRGFYLRTIGDNRRAVSFEMTADGKSHASGPLSFTDGLNPPTFAVPVGAEHSGWNLDWRRVAVTLKDAAGVPMRTISWDVSRVADAAEILTLVRWRCLGFDLPE